MSSPAPDDAFKVWIKFWRSEDGVWHLKAFGTEEDKTAWRVMVENIIPEVPAPDPLDVPV